MKVYYKHSIPPTCV